MKSAFGLAALSLLLAVPAHAQTSWSTDFDTTLQGSFDSASAPLGLIETFSGDGVLALPGTATASFTFTTTADSPFFLVTFWTSTNGGATNGGTLNATLGSQTEGFTVPNPGAIGPNPNPDGASYSYHFGSAGTPWAAGTYTLTFDNAPSDGFRLDDVSVSAVPEPSAWALAMIAAVAVAGLARRRRGGGAA